MKDYYKILGISKDASKDDIQKIFRQLAHIYHPDKGGNEQKFKEVNEAYSVLSDDKKRIEYDSNYDAFIHNEQRGGFSRKHSETSYKYENKNDGGNSKNTGREDWKKENMENKNEQFGNQKIITLVLVIVTLYMILWGGPNIMSIFGLLGSVAGWAAAVIFFRMIVRFLIKISKIEKVDKIFALNVALAICLLLLLLLLDILPPMDKSLSDINKSNDSSLATPPQNQQWKEFRTDYFSVLLPSNPTFDSDANLPVDDPQRDIIKGVHLLNRNSWNSYDSNLDEVYSVNRLSISTPVDISDPDIFLKKFVDSGSENSANGILTSSQYISFGSYRALEILVQGNYSSFSKARIILVNQTLYVLEYHYNDYNDINYDKFVNSFQLQ